MTLTDTQRAVANLLLVQAVWFVCVLGGTLFLHGLQWLRSRPWLAAACGAVAGPATYYSGAMLHGVNLGITTEKFVLCLAILWAIMTPLFGAICAGHQPTTEPAHG